jgi:hypothetical protein
VSKYAPLKKVKRARTLCEVYLRGAEGVSENPAYENEAEKKAGYKRHSAYFPGIACDSSVSYWALLWVPLFSTLFGAFIQRLYPVPVFGICIRCCRLMPVFSITIRRHSSACLLSVPTRCPYSGPLFGNPVWDSYSRNSLVSRRRGRTNTGIYIGALCPPSFIKDLRVQPMHPLLYTNLFCYIANMINIIGVSQRINCVRICTTQEDETRACPPRGLPSCSRRHR